MACDMPEPYKFPSLDSCQKRFLQTHEEVNLAPHPVVGLVLQVGDTEMLLQALGLESQDSLIPASNSLHFTPETQQYYDMITRK